MSFRDWSACPVESALPAIGAAATGLPRARRCAPAARARSTPASGAPGIGRVSLPILLGPRRRHVDRRVLAVIRLLRAAFVVDRPPPCKRPLARLRSSLAIAAVLASTALCHGRLNALLDLGFRYRADADCVRLAGAGAATVRTMVTGAGAGLSAKTTSDAESIAAHANPRRAPEFQNAASQRRQGEGSKILSETKAMRCGISSSGSERSAAPSDAQPVQLFAARRASFDMGFHLPRRCGSGSSLRK